MRGLPAFLVLATIAVRLLAGTYYVDFDDGLDTNTGQQKAAYVTNGTVTINTNGPWKLAPGLVGFSGSYTPASGDRFIFKGGVTWPYSTMPLTITRAGTYYGVDSTWYSGSSWVHPVLDQAGVDRSAYATNHNLRNVGCALYNADNVTVEGIEVKGILMNNASAASAIECFSFSFFNSDNSLLTNVIARDWVLGVYEAISGGGVVQFGSANAWVKNSLISGGTNHNPIYTDGTGIFVAGHGFQAGVNSSNCIVRNVVTVQQNGSHYKVDYFAQDGENNGFHPGAHENCAWIRTGTLANSRLRSANYGVGMYFIPGEGGVASGTGRVFNNSFWDIPQINVTCQEAPVGNTLVQVFAHNVVRKPGTCINVGTTKTGAPIQTLIIANNIFISDYVGTADESRIINIVQQADVSPTAIIGPNVFLTTAEANALGMTEGNDYIPPAVFDQIAGRGINLTAYGITSDINGNPRPANGSTDIGPVQFTGNSGVTNVAPVFVIHPAETTVQAGAIVVFSASASGTPTPTYQWYRNGVAITGATSTAYSFATVLGDNDAIFKVTATNSEGSVDSNNARLIVQSPPVPGQTVYGTRPKKRK